MKKLSDLPYPHNTQTVTFLHCGKVACDVKHAIGLHLEIERVDKASDDSGALAEGFAMERPLCDPFKKWINPGRRVFVSLCSLFGTRHSLHD